MTEQGELAPTANDAAAAVETVLGAMTNGDGPVNLCVLTDEEIYALTEDEEVAQPFGVYFENLDDGHRQAAAGGALRVLTSRGLLDAELPDEGDPTLELSTEVAAALALRSRDAQLSLQTIGQVAQTWYILRYVRDGVFLRETVTTQGFHLMSLVRLGAQERDVFLAQLRLPEEAETAEVPELDVRLTEAELEAAQVGATSPLAFVEDTELVGNLVYVPAVEGIQSSIVHVLRSGQLVVGELTDDAVHYRGSEVAALRSWWDTWSSEVASVLRGAGPGQG